MKKLKLILKTGLLSCLLVLFNVSFAKKKDKKDNDSEAVILTIADDKITTNEFDYNYKKNHSKNPDAYSEKSLKEYLDLYINFRLKVKEAEELKYDQTKEFIREFNQYKGQLAAPYLTEKEVTNKLVKEAYERLKTEVNASHILIKFPENPTPTDTLNALKQIQSIQAKVKEGKDFEELAYKYSQDPSAKKNNGNLGYFTSLQMVYPFENAAYNTAKGEVSDIIKTQFGYHLVKVNDKRPARGEVQVSHIMIRAVEGMNPGDLVQAEQKIKDIKQKLDNGEDWIKLCQLFSDDLKSAQRGGMLPWLSTGKVTPEFEDVAFSLEKVGDISDPVKTPFGWHVIRLEGKRNLDSFDKMKATIEARIMKDSRSDLPKTAFIKRVKKENSFKLNEKVKKYALSVPDSSIFKAKWKFDRDNKKLKSRLFEIADKDYNLKGFFEYLEKRQRLNTEGKNIKSIVEEHLDQYIDMCLMRYEESNLENKYEEYKYTLKEYRYGILLFKLMDEKVWTKALKDTLGLRTYYNGNKDKYQWQDRVNIEMINTNNLPNLNKAKDMIKKGMSLKEIQEEINKEGSLNAKIEEGLFERNDRDYLKDVEWKPGTYEFTLNGRNYLVTVKEVIPSGQKKFEETRGKLISDYQNKLEKEWIAELREKYNYELNQDEFDKLIR